MKRKAMTQCTDDTETNTTPLHVLEKSLNSYKQQNMHYHEIGSINAYKIEKKS